MDAVRFPMAGWPANGVLRGTDGPGPLLERQISDDAHFQALRPTRTFARELGEDSLSFAFAFAVAALVPQR